MRGVTVGADETEGFAGRTGIEEALRHAGGREVRVGGATFRTYREHPNAEGKPETVDIAARATRP